MCVDPNVFGPYNLQCLDVIIHIIAWSSWFWLSELGERFVSWSTTLICFFRDVEGQHVTKPCLLIEQYISVHDILGTVDGRNPANQLVSSLSNYLQGFYTSQVSYIPGGAVLEYLWNHTRHCRAVGVEDASAGLSKVKQKHLQHRWHWTFGWGTSLADWNVVKIYVSI